MSILGKTGENPNFILFFQVLAGSLLYFNGKILMTFESPCLRFNLPDLVCQEISFCRYFWESSDNAHAFPGPPICTFPKSLSTLVRHLAPDCSSCSSASSSTHCSAFYLEEKALIYICLNLRPQYNSVFIFSICNLRHNLSADLGLDENDNCRVQPGGSREF